MENDHFHIRFLFRSLYLLFFRQDLWLKLFFPSKSNFLERFKSEKIKLESYSYIPKSKIPDILRVLNLGMFPKKVLSDLGTAILKISPTFKFNFFANE